ncbi:MAG: hypothetical protein AAGD14_11015 [Planctomycetota bacterium]
MRRASCVLVSLIACSSTPPEEPPTPDPTFPSETFWAKVTGTRPPCREPLSPAMQFLAEIVVSVHCDEVPAARALADLGALARVPIRLTEHADDDIGASPITLGVCDVTLRDALELILMQASSCVGYVYVVREGRVEIRRHPHPSSN